MWQLLVTLQLQTNPSWPCFDTRPQPPPLCQGSWCQAYQLRTLQRHCKARVGRRGFSSSPEVLLPTAASWLSCGGCSLWPKHQPQFTLGSCPWACNHKHSLHGSAPSNTLWQVYLPQVGWLFLWQPDLHSRGLNLSLVGRHSSFLFTFLYPWG